MASYLELSGLEKNPNFQKNIDAAKAITQNKWAGANDFYWNYTPLDPKNAAYTSAEIKMEGKVFFVANPMLYAGMRTSTDPNAAAENKNPAGDLRNLSVSNSQESKGMATWLTDNAKLTPKPIMRSLTARWTGAGAGIITDVKVTPNP